MTFNSHYVLALCTLIAFNNNTLFAAAASESLPAPAGDITVRYSVKKKKLRIITTNARADDLCISPDGAMSIYTQDHITYTPVPVIHGEKRTLSKALLPLTVLQETPVLCHPETKLNYLQLRNEIITDALANADTICYSSDEETDEPINTVPYTPESGAILLRYCSKHTQYEWLQNTYPWIDDLCVQSDGETSICVLKELVAVSLFHRGRMTDFTVPTTTRTLVDLKCNAASKKFYLQLRKNAIANVLAKTCEK